MLFSFTGTFRSVSIRGSTAGRSGQRSSWLDIYQYFVATFRRHLLHKKSFSEVWIRSFLHELSGRRGPGGDLGSRCLRESPAVSETE